MIMVRSTYLSDNMTPDNTRSNKCLIWQFLEFPNWLKTIDFYYNRFVWYFCQSPTVSYYPIGTVVTFQEAWNQFRMNDSSDFVDIPPLAVLSTMLAMFLFHIIASPCILKQKLKSKSFFTLVSKGFYTLISPPLHFDWEFFYRQSAHEDNILMCWKR